MSSPALPAFSTQFDEETRLFEDALQRMSRDVFLPARREQDTVATSAKLSELGLLDLWYGTQDGTPEPYNPIHAYLAYNQLSRGDMGHALAALAPIGAASLVTQWGSASQIDRVCGDLLSGKHWAIAIDEAKLGFDPLAAGDYETRISNGKVSGTKVAVSHLPDTAGYLVVANDDGEIRIAMVDANDAEHQAQPGMGLDALQLHTVRFDASDGEVLEASIPLSELVGRLRLGLLSAVVGQCHSVIDYVVPYVNERVAFDEPISYRQSIAFSVADMGIEARSLELLTSRAVARLALALQGLDAGDADWLAAQQQAFTFALKHAPVIGSQGVQLLGGHGFTEEHPVELFFRNLRAVGCVNGAAFV